MKIIKNITLIGMWVFAQCSAPVQVQDPIPQHTSFTLYSDVLGESRTLNVWTPEGYDQQNDSLAVLYMPDGGIGEDFPHIANTLEQLILDNKIPPMILVGIENTERRRDLTGFTSVEKDKEIAPVVGGSNEFRLFIKNELFPKIEKDYRTKSERSLIGESLAGLFVVETFLLDPEMFDNYIAFDPSLWWNNQFLLGNAEGFLSQFTQSEKMIWFASSQATDIYQHTQKLKEVFEDNLPNNMRYVYKHAPEEKHHTIFRALKEEALISTFGTNKNL